MSKNTNTITISKADFHNLLTEVGKKASQLTLEICRSIGSMTPDGSADKLIISSIGSIAANAIKKSKGYSKQAEAPESTFSPRITENQTPAGNQPEATEETPQN